MAANPADEQLQLMWRVVGAAFIMSSEVVAGLLLGWVVQKWMGVDHAMIYGALVGIVVGLTTFVRSAFRLSQKQAALRSSASVDSTTSEDSDHD